MNESVFAFDGLGNSTTAMQTPDNISSENFTRYEQVQSGQEVIAMIEKCLMPLICMIGLVGNTMSSIVFLRHPLRLSSCSLFLATRSIADNGFLSTLLLVWISMTFELQLSRIKGLCQLSVYMTYVCGCLSIWFVVFVTLENYIRICKPFLVRRVCNVRHAKRVILLAVIVVLCFYNFSLWITDEICTPLPKYVGITQFLVYGDTIVTLIIPTIIVTLSMGAITVTVLRSANFRRRSNITSNKRHKIPLGQITRLLYSVTVSFFCLTFPSHVVRLRLLIMMLLGRSRYMTKQDANILAITLLLYYVSMSISAMIYYTFGCKFRHVFKATFFICNRKNRNKYKLEERGNKSGTLSNGATETTTKDTEVQQLKFSTTC